MNLERYTAIQQIHFSLDCIQITSNTFLEPLPGCVPEKIPRLYVARYDTGHVRFVRHDLPRSVYEQLVRLPAETMFDDQETVKRILAEDVLCDEAWMGKSYLFPEIPCNENYIKAVKLDVSHQAAFSQFSPGENISEWPMYAVIIGGQIVSTCQSSQENAYAGEAWVRTLPTYRRRGFARQVTTAWAHGLQQRGKIPFYSHRTKNIQSQALARSLDLIAYKVEITYF